MRSFDSLTEQEILALAITLEEEDARIYDDFADGLKENYPEQAEKFKAMRADEDGHRHRLLELHRARFGDHVPLIRREDVRGFALPAHWNWSPWKGVNAGRTRPRLPIGPAPAGAPYSAIEIFFGPGASPAAALSVAPPMKALQRSRASESRIWTGGHFM